MALQRILYVASEISPFLETSLVASCVRKLPEAMQGQQLDVRLIVPKFGIISDRMNRLHEVLRLSGTVVSFQDTDHVVSVKVSTIPNTRLQVYFIDNPALFGNRKAVFQNQEGAYFEDNDIRMVFFCASVIQTLKRLEWEPDIVHCHDWITSLVPLLWRQEAQANALFTKAKLVSTVYNNFFSSQFPNLATNMMQLGIPTGDAALANPGTFRSIVQLALQHSDTVICGEALDATAFEGIFAPLFPRLIANDHQYCDAYLELYTNLIRPQ